MLRPATLLRMPKFHFLFPDEPTQIAEYFPAVEGKNNPFEYVEEQTDPYLEKKEGQYLAHNTRAKEGDKGGEDAKKQSNEKKDAKDKAKPSENPHRIGYAYLHDAWDLLTYKPPEAGAQPVAASSSQGAVACMSCHAIGAGQLQGEAESQGPNLKYTPERFQPGYLKAWIANPKRLLPYTMMPQNIPNTPAAVSQNLFKGSPEEQVTALRDALLNMMTVLQDSLASKSQGPAADGSKKSGESQ